RARGDHAHERLQVRELQTGHGEGRQVVQVSVGGAIEAMLVADRGDLRLEGPAMALQPLAAIGAAQVLAELRLLALGIESEAERPGHARQRSRGVGSLAACPRGPARSSAWSSLRSATTQLWSAFSTGTPASG